MTKDLSAFFAQNAGKPENIKRAISPRFKGANGKPIEFEFKALTVDKDEEIRKECIKSFPITQGKGKGGQRKEFDEQGYLTKMTIESMVFPNLKDAELQTSYNVMGAEDLFKVMFLPAETYDLFSAAKEANGFELEMPDLVEEAKN